MPFDQGPADKRTLSKLTSAAGAYSVPTSFYGQLIEHLIPLIHQRIGGLPC